MYALGQPSETAAPELTRYTATFLDLFDTLTTVVGYAESEEEFTRTMVLPNAPLSLMSCSISFLSLIHI